MPKNLLFLSVLILTLLSCSKEADKLRFSSWQSSPTEERIIRECLEDFKKAQPEIDFDYQPIPGNYPEKIQLMLGTGKAPDLFWLKGDTAPAYLNFEVLKPLDEFLEQDPDFDVDDFFPVFKDAFKYKGKYYGFGKDFNAYVLFYNEDMFKEAGINEPPKDWRELEAFAKALTTNDPANNKITRHGMVIEPTIDMVLPFAFQNNGQIIDAENTITIGEPAFTEALEFYISLYENNIATIPADQGAGWNGDVFGRGKAAMAVSGAWMIPYLKENYPDINFKVAELPAGKRKATVAFCNAYVMPENSKFASDSWAMISYLAGKEGMKTWTSSGIALPTRKSVALENGFYEDSTFGVFMKSTEYATMYKVNLKERWFSECESAMQGIFYKKKNATQSFQELAKRLEKYKLN